MKRFYNKETRVDERFYRFEDWSVSKPDDWSKPNFTDLVPPEETLKYGIPCDFIGGAWVIDESSEEFLTLYQRKREEEYPPEKEVIIALWEKVVENRPEAADALEVKRQAVKVKIPKPDK